MCFAAATFCGANFSGAQDLKDRSGDADALPEVLPGFQIEFVAGEPLVRNPCAMAFDFTGRLFVGMGPQYRNPAPDTPGDSVFLLQDTSGDGRFDSRSQFATGFNSIQSIAWRGKDLWIANAPDLTVVRDLDGDDVADEYVRIFTDLGNLEHGLHGLTWGPDGRLYMSKGNSKGLTRPGRIAPAPFRDLWGVTAPAGSPDFPPPQTFTAKTYRRVYHNPADDWGREGGVLVCDEMGKNLEIVSRGFRNPWDIAFDSGFHWQGTDNDQNAGDRVFTPFFGSHYGWGHPWSPHWTGHEHPPTAPITGPVFHGSGTGIVFYDAFQFPKPFRGAWFFNDWLRRSVFFYRPIRDGALTQPEGGHWRKFITGGNSLFKPTDIEIGPDGSLYLLGWGRAYGAEFDKTGAQTNEGRIFRVSWKQAPLFQEPLKFRRALSDWSHQELIAEFDSSIPVRRTTVQTELIRRHATTGIDPLLKTLHGSGDNQSRQTWTLWTIGRLQRSSLELDNTLAELARTGAINIRIQSLRILGHRIRVSDQWRAFPDSALDALDADSPRVRLEAVLALRRGSQQQSVNRLLATIARETDRIVFYAAWQALRVLTSSGARHTLLSDARPRVRCAALLSLAEDRDLQDEEVTPLIADVDEQTRHVAALWMVRRSNSPFLMVDPQPGDFDGHLKVRVTSAIKPADVRVTLDGSEPTAESPRWNGTVTISRSTTLRAGLFVNGRRVGPVASLPYRKLSGVETAARCGIVSVSAKSERHYRVVERGLAEGNPVYTDRDYRFTTIPDGFRDSFLIRTANNDSGSRGSHFLEMESVMPVTVFCGHDTRISKPPAWLLDPDRGFTATSLVVRTNDAVFRLYQRHFEAGRIALGGNTDSGDPDGKSNYLIILRPISLPKLEQPTMIDHVLPLIADANPERGRVLFFAGRGAACTKCHRADDSGSSFGPDLAHLVDKQDPVQLVRSILEPSAEIKEGFSTQTILMNNGQTVSGLLRRQSASALTLIQPDGRIVAVPTADIAERFSQKVSAMPDFRFRLKPQQVADMTAWLLTRRNGTGSAEIPARRSPSVQPPGTARHEGGSPAKAYSPKTAQFSIEQQDDRMIVRLNGRRLATYLHKHRSLTRPAWIDVYSPGGIRLTRNFPPRLPEDRGAMDHALMHPGIWISFGDLDGEDYWRLTSRTEHVEFIGKPDTKPGRADFTVRNRYLRRDGRRVVCEEVTKYSLIARPEGVLMLIEARFESHAQDFYFGDQEESGLAFRMESRLKVQDGHGTIRNNRGERNGSAMWGKEAAWVDYSGTLAGRRAGLMVMPGLTNTRRCWMHTRDYGLVAANPFPRQPQERRAPYVKTMVKRGEPYRISYALLLHDQPADQSLDREFIYTEVMKYFARESGMRTPDIR